MSKILELLDINKFIKENNLKEVKSPEIFLPNSNTFHPEGVYSEEIFGKLGTKKREQIFAYIDLKGKYIHPEVFDIVKFIIPKINNVLIGKTFITLNNKGVIVEYSEDNKKINSDIKVTGIEGIYKLLTEYKDKINWDYYRSKDEKITDFILDNLDRIFIDKWLVIPAGLREIQEINNQYQEQEISKEYRRLLYLIKNKNTNESNLSKSLFEEDNIDFQTDFKIQQLLLRIVKLIETILKSKTGIIRGAKLSKRVDHVARLVLGHDSNLNANEVGVPWFVLLKLYEPFVIHYITKKPEYSNIASDIVNKFDNLSVNTIKQYLNNIAQHPENVDADIKNSLIDILQRIIDGKDDKTPKYVMVLRHPVESRDSILGLRPKIITDNVHVARLPQVLFSPLGADTNWDELVVCVDGKYMKLHIKDLEKYIEPLEIREFIRDDGVKVKQILIKNNIEVLSYDRIKKEFVIDKIIAWMKHENIKMNKVKIGDTYHIMSPRKETLLDENDVLLKPTKDIVGKKIKNINNYMNKLTDSKVKEFISYMDLQEDNTVYEVEETDITYGWDISTYETGTYVDKYGYVKKQCDGNGIDCRH